MHRLLPVCSLHHRISRSLWECGQFGAQQGLLLTRYGQTPFFLVMMFPDLSRRIRRSGVSLCSCFLGDTRASEGRRICIAHVYYIANGRDKSPRCALRASTTDMPSQLPCLPAGPIHGWTQSAASKTSHAPQGQHSPCQAPTGGRPSGSGLCADNYRVHGDVAQVGDSGSMRTVGDGQRLGVAGQEASTHHRARWAAMRGPNIRVQAWGGQETPGQLRVARRSLPAANHTRNVSHYFFFPCRPHCPKPKGAGLYGD